ncbi:hypothetical protein H9X57_10570 [Flavobacterium piscinae]|uniref:hypothetical protein n=1 Tax=Flavobacterium piscinae TaxID=2506424 RepID=UPI0019C92E47|nr:hypothetical protein [Flavobacterium piscinae]MBC8883649.1 hypothetical protein [Flavobacterium piscinae]
MQVEFEEEENEEMKAYNKNVEIEKLKMTLDENHLKLLEIIIKQDSLENLKKLILKNELKT